jgi:hypothetical protein
MIPRKFLQEWADEQRRAFLAVVGLSEHPAVAQTASAENQEPILEEPVQPRAGAGEGLGSPHGEAGPGGPLKTPSASRTGPG